MPERWALVGRDVELAKIATALSDPGVGGVILFGPAGVGKTRLAREAVELAVAEGAVARSARATPSTSEVPFAALNPLVPELDLAGEAIPGMFRAVAETVESIRGGQRLVLMVDDAHELDDASASLLEQIVGLGNTFVVLTIRNDANPTQTLVNLWKDEQIARIDLAPISEAGIRELATNALGPVETATLQALVTASAGNVLYLRELIQGCQESGTLVHHYGIWRLTGALAGSLRLQDLIGTRLGDLSPDQRRALELVALGDPLDLDLLSSLVQLEIVESLEECDLLDTVDSDSGPQVTLAHPLYGEVVRVWLPAARRARLSKALADATEASAVERPRDVIRVAVWRLEGGGGTNARSSY